MKLTLYKIDAFWDIEAAVWVATSENVPGLVTEADSLEALDLKLRDLIPELLILNEVIPKDYKGIISFELTSHKQEIIEVA
ncbi:MAG: DUF1902 domain-containing protein [Thainema sp.]